MLNRPGISLYAIRGNLTMYPVRGVETFIDLSRHLVILVWKVHPLCLKFLSYPKMTYIVVLLGPDEAQL
jgi:hypothetical protein